MARVLPSGEKARLRPPWPEWGPHDTTVRTTSPVATSCNTTCQWGYSSLAETKNWPSGLKARITREPLSLRHDERVVPSEPSISDHVRTEPLTHMAAVRPFPATTNALV